MLEIDQQTDVIVPFQRIGDAGWQDRTRLILEAWADLNEDEIASPVVVADLNLLEQRLNTSLPESLKVFYQTFGIADLGEELQPLEQIEYLQQIWAKAPQYRPDFSASDLAVLPHLISFSDYLGNGNIFCFHAETHEVFYFDHDTSPYLSKIFSCVDEYFCACLILLQAEFWANARPDEVEQWVEDKVIELFGAATLKKWRY